MLIDAEGAIVALDFGIMGRIDLRHAPPPGRDPAGLSQPGLRARRGRVLPRRLRARRTRTSAAFQQACRAIGEPILDLPLNEISIGRLLGQLLTVAEQFEMEQQPQLVLLQKTMAVSEGVGRALNPSVNIWQLAQPLVEGWIRANLGPEAQVRRVIGDGLAMLQAAADAGGQDRAPGTRPGGGPGAAARDRGQRQLGLAGVAVAGVGAGLLLGYLIR